VKRVGRAGPDWSRRDRIAQARKAREARSIVTVKQCPHCGGSHEFGKCSGR
jgi:hypothetical protein